MRKVLSLVLVSFFLIWCLAGCAGAVSGGQFVGENINAVIAKYGNPNSTYPAGQGETAYVFCIDGNCTNQITYFANAESFCQELWKFDFAFPFD